MSEESIIAESYSNLKDAILLGRTDIVRGILSTAAESRFENGFFEDDEEERDGEDFRIRKWDEDYEDNPYDILRVMLNFIDNDAGTALHLATKLGNADITRALLSAGADPTRINKEGATPFEYCTDEKILRVYNEQLLEAAAHSQLTKLERLLNAGVSANAGDGTESNNRAIHWAATFGGHEAVKLLCEHNADVNAKNRDGSTALFDAVKRRDKAILEILLTYGARTDISLTQGSNKGKTPVDLAPDNSEIKDLLLNPPEKIVLTPEKSHNETNGPLNESDVVDRDSISSLSSLGETKSDVKITENGEAESAREIDLTLLWPYPQQLTLIKGSRYYPEAYLSIRILTHKDEDPYNIQDMWRAVDESFKKLGFSLRVLFVSDEDHGVVPGCITCSISPLLFSKTESYSIHVSSQRIRLRGSEPRALWYSINTLLQLFRLSHGVGIPQMQINDWPDLKYRAFLVDSGHGRTLNSDSLLFLVDVLSNLKYNQMVLCVQNGFLFEKHEEACKDYSRYSQSEILKLDRYCRKRYIELIPFMDHISDFGRWLKHDKYKNLGKSPAVNCTSEGTSTSECLCPENVETASFVRDLNSQLCTSFPTARFIHVGLSNVTDCDIKSKTSTDKDLPIIKHARNINENSRKHKKACMMWTNSFHDYLKHGHELPEGMIAMEYGGKSSYEFGVFCKLCSDSGVPYYVCPGTMNWTSLVGADSIDLIDDAVQTAVLFNALGILVTDWSAYGHVSPVEVSLPAFAAGGALAWNSKIKQESVVSTLPKVLNVHVFQDEAAVIGNVLQNLTQVHRILQPRPVPTDDVAQHAVYPGNNADDASQLLQLFLFPNDVKLNNLDSDNIQKASRCLRKNQASLAKTQMKCHRASTTVKALHLVLDMALYSCRVGRGLLIGKSDKNSEAGFTATSCLPSIMRTDLANRLLGIIENHRRIWPLNNKPGGVEESVKILQRVFDEIVPSSTLSV
ncbi:uncharacterized protein LOC114522343 [Dendronephthya gigantea]|uniref:uncharacterized protein LOC114522343 n=1 Tax=Dendronephthya gigantea TaxID=151771 RepID=UPI001068DB0A|nr:uncharacterized protein LOC114522343 [Dendronephthya gigantea]XP_028398814.1 uncharacterized protein LOC114522343 [Dendronephthya gigantea]